MAGTIIKDSDFRTLLGRIGDDEGVKNEGRGRYKKNKARRPSIANGKIA
jgi:hypothetical protein